jgi:hypothetical protein
MSLGKSISPSVGGSEGTASALGFLSFFLRRVLRFVAYWRSSVLAETGSAGLFGFDFFFTDSGLGSFVFFLFFPTTGRAFSSARSAKAFFSCAGTERLSSSFCVYGVSSSHLAGLDMVLGDCLHDVHSSAPAVQEGEGRGHMEMSSASRKGLGRSVHG